MAHWGFPLLVPDLVNIHLFLQIYSRLLCFLSHTLLVLLTLAPHMHYPQVMPAAKILCYCALRPLRLIPTHYIVIYSSAIKS